MKEVLKRKERNRSTSKQSVTSSRMSLNTISSLNRLGNTINASKDSFQACLKSSIERPLPQPETIRLKLLSDQVENIPSNMGMYKGRNNASLSSLNAKTTMNDNRGYKMIKSNTLTKLKPNESAEVKKLNLMQTMKPENMNRASHAQLRTIQVGETPKTAHFKVTDSHMQTLNDSYTSGKAVDCSDMVLKGDVMPVLARNGSYVDSSHKTLKMDEILRKQSSHQPTTNNFRYGGTNETQSDFMEIMSPKDSPDIIKHMAKVRHPDVQATMQAQMIEKLQKEVSSLKEKLQFYEKNCK